MDQRTKLDRSRRPPSGAAPRIELPRFQRTQLGNGLTLLIVPHDNLPEISGRLIVPFGAAADTEGRNGSALMTARALTEGTELRSAREVARELDFLGIKFSMDVTHDATVLRLGVLDRVFYEAMELFVEITSRPAFDEGEVERLRDERQDEIARGLDEPRIIANLRLSEAIYGGHPYGVREGGTEETVSRLTAADLRDFHQRFYRPDAATLVLVGQLPEVSELAARLEQMWSGWEGQAAHSTTLQEPQPISSRRVWAVNRDGPQSEIRIGGLGIARQDPDYAAVMVMNSIVGGLFSSRINMNLREDKGWTYGASSRFDARKLRGPLRMSTAVDAQHTIGAVQEMLAELEGMKTRPPTDEELSLARNALTLSMPRLFETVGQVSARVAHQLIYDLPEDYWATYTDQVRAASAVEVQEAAERYLDTDRLTVVVVGPVRDLRDELKSLGPLEFRDIKGRPVD